VKVEDHQVRKVALFNLLQDLTTLSGSLHNISQFFQKLPPQRPNVGIVIH